MTEESEIRAEKSAKFYLSKRHLIFFLILVGLIGGAILRSSIATRLDSFTYDEAYHVGAGAAYIQTGDFRLNPEHPPLVKLWTGAFVSGVYILSPYRTLADKVDEREFVENDVYNNNDSDLIKIRSRMAMFALNGLLLFLFALAARRVFGDIIALSAAAFLAIDPTVAAHLPVVMTDLPVALTSATAVLLGVQAFRSWGTVDLILAALSLGLTLSAKHSAVITLIAVAVIGFLMVAFLGKDTKMNLRLRRLASVAAVLIGAVIILWSFYLFRFSESPNTNEDQFNRTLAEKISDVKTPLYRTGLQAMSEWYLFPRSYTWGMADTIRAGAEGRVGSALAFGKLYYGKAPRFYFPGAIAVKVPLGLLLLTLVGAAFLLMRRMPQEFLLPFLALFGFSILFLIFLVKGSSYGGIRHALPVFPLLALLASVAAYEAIKSRSYLLSGTVAAALIAALISAVPVVRPWEYFNETVGGTANGHRYFDDEGVDLYQRGKEAITYYHEVLKPAGEVPYTFYLLPSIKDPAKTLDYVGKDSERDSGKWDGDTATGIFIVGANEIAPTLWWDKKAFREAEPVARFGNLFVFRGTFDIRSMSAQGLAYKASFQIHGPEPNIEKAIEMLSKSVEIDPKAFFVALELGNQYLKVGNHEEALRAYRIAKENVPASDETSELLIRQIERVETEPLDQIQPVRNPGME